MNTYIKNSYEQKQTLEPPTINPDELTAVFVSMDGTLLDSLSGLYKVYLTFLSEYHIKGNKIEFNDIRGLVLTEAVSQLKNRYHLKSYTSELENHYKELYFEFYQKNVSFFPHAIETLRLIKSLDLKVIMVTPASNELVEKIVHNPQIRGIFDDILTGDTVTQGKPHPQIFEYALSKTQIKSNQGMVIEDNPQGVSAALNANLYVMQHCPKLSERHRFHPGFVEVKNWEIIEHLFRFFYS